MERGDYVIRNSLRHPVGEFRIANYDMLCGICAGNPRSNLCVIRILDHKDKDNIGKVAIVDPRYFDVVDKPPNIKPKHCAINKSYIDKNKKR